MNRVRASSSNSSTISSWIIRMQHRATDFANLAAFTLCPMDSWPTQVKLNTHLNSKLGSKVVLNIEQWTSLGSGGFVWDGARRLAQQLQAYEKITSKSSTDNEQLSWAGQNVIELGAGTGALGLAIATTLGANVTLTDQASFVFPTGNGTTLKPNRSLLQLMEINVQNNRKQHPQTQPGQQPVQVCEMLWGSRDPQILAALPHQTYDIVVASDVLLFQSAQSDFLSTLQQLSKPETIILIEHTDRSKSTDLYPPELINFLGLLEQDSSVSWTYSIIKDHGRHITLLIERK